ncbi:MAG TPA: DUF1800 domain-containing protein [Usitatibacter sp.]|nr:DUF1800 domain-containing protein [Usitatibacter sp.]
MRIPIAILALLAPLAAGAVPIGYDGARHLLDRAGFGATDAEIREYAALDRREAVDRLLAGARTEALTPPPAFVHEPFVPVRELRAMAKNDPKAFRGEIVRQGLELRAWWIGEMLATPSPLTERMTLFWHNHFATSQQKVKLAQLMYRQNVLLRREALGNFGALLHGVAKDPAMLIYLDNARSRREAPNENFAREVMELFTLGVGHYGERDVKEAARAFTGFSLDPDTGAYRYRPFFHDPGEKTVLGVSGRLDGDQVIDILLARPETARFVAAKLWREFVSPTPDEAVVERWAAVFRGAHYEVKPLLRAIFLSDAFWDPANRASLVKSPVDLVVGTLRTFDVHPADLRPAAVACAAFGQNLFAPPNVKGWPGGDAWIDTATLLGRKEFVDRVFRGSAFMESLSAPDDGGMRQAGMQAQAAPGPGARLERLMEVGMGSYTFNAARWSRSLGATRDPAELDRLVLAADPADPVPAGLDAAARVRALASDPVYQLK